MKKYLILLVVSLVMFQMNAQTVVSGGIFNNTTWQVNGSPYLVVGDVIVFPGVHLTIEPGVEVRFAVNTKLEVREGGLTAIGTSNAIIKFTVDDPNPTPSTKWEGIENTSLTNNFTMEFSHIHLEYAQTAIDYGEGYKSYTIENATLENNDTGIHSLGGGYMWITVYNSTFINNKIGMQGSMSVYNSIFDGNETGFADPRPFQNYQGGRVVNCLFTNNDMAIGPYAVFSPFTVIDSSTFVNNDIGVIAYWGEVRNSIFNNTTNHGVRFTRGQVQNNQFKDNGIGIIVPYNPYKLSIYNNLLETNATGIQIEGPGALVEENYLCNNTNYAVVSTTDQPIDLNNNCWCTIDLAQIASMVFDAYDDPTLGIASFQNPSIDCKPNPVYPGDANNNAHANVADLLQIGLAYGMTGPTRDSATTNWIGQEAFLWSVTFPNNVNAKHADSNGDGVVNHADVPAINDNYNQTHTDSTRYQPPVINGQTFKLSLEMPDTIYKGQLVDIDILLGDSASIVPNLYGISFTMQSDSNLFVKDSFLLDINDSWLGHPSQLLSLHHMPDSSRIEIAMVRKNQQSVSGFGKIATLRIVMSEDIIVTLKNGMDPSQLFIQLLNIEAITSAGYAIDVIGDSKEVITMDNDDLQDKLEDPILIYPNPAKERIYIEHPFNVIERVRILSINGQVLQTSSQVRNELQLFDFTSGIYLLELQTENGLFVKKLVIN